jgi:NAD(P)-dependent dehydrogenase (short-subunit alcohol dehydrogenase family)
MQSNNKTTREYLNMSLEQQVFLVTGCSSGFGFHLAERFLAQGHKVAVTARDVTKVSGFEKKYPQTALSLALDVTNQISRTNAIAKTIEKFGRIDVLINNAGFSIFTAAENFTEQEFRSVMETNFFGAMFMSQAVVPIMRKQRSGTIIQITSTMGVAAYASASAYCASKFALEGFSEALAMEVAPHGIRVIIAEPGSFKTSFGDKLIQPTSLDLESYDSIKQFFAMYQAIKGLEPGDPERFAVAIEKILSLEKPPLRIPLGNDAIHLVRTHANQQLADLEKFKEISTSTDFDPMPEATLAFMKNLIQQQI